MINKKLLALFGISFIIVIALAFLYSKYWREPAAKYVKTDNPKLIQIRQDLKELKLELKKNGLYSCCIQNECNWCALHMEHCPCAKLVSAKGNEKSCPECAAAWNKKQGRIPGVDPDAIEVTTFGIYGFEEGGHHQPDSSEDKTKTANTPHREGGEY